MTLYILNAEGTNLYKIGITKNNPSARIKSLQTGNPHTIGLVWEYKSEYTKDIEKTLHRHYSYCRTSGEWFLFDKISIDEVKEKIVKMEETIKIMKENEECSDRY